MVTGVGYGCTACIYAPEQYNDIEVIAAGTELNRSFDNNLEVLKIQNFCFCVVLIVNIPQIWNKLVNKKGKIKKATGDYAVRKGVTQEPVADIDFYGEILEDYQESQLLPEFLDK